MSAKGTKLRKGRRELNKEDKLRRIKDAARRLFITKGYDETSTRQIATTAGVAQATLFLYAANKRDLLFLTVNDELELVSHRAAEVPKPDASFIENLNSALGVVYEFFGRERELARLILREMTFYGTGAQGKRFSSTRERMISICCEVARMAQDRGDIGKTYDHVRVGSVVFMIYQIELRKWLAGRRTDVDEGLLNLRNALEVVITGLSPSAKAFELRQAQKVPRRKSATTS